MAHAALTPDGRLVSTFATDPDMQELVGVFIEELGSHIDKIQSALSSGQLDEVRSIAHQLKGAGGGYGFMPITEAALTLETAVKTQANLAAITKAMDELVDLCKRAAPK